MYYFILSQIILIAFVVIVSIILFVWAMIDKNRFIGDNDLHKIFII